MNAIKAKSLKLSTAEEFQNNLRMRRFERFGITSPAPTDLPDSPRESSEITKKSVKLTKHTRKAPSIKEKPSSLSGFMRAFSIFRCFKA